MAEPAPPRGTAPPPAEVPARALGDAPADRDGRPATVGDLRSLRRWLLVTAAWAVAATAIAVIALIAATRDDSADQERQSARTAAQIDRLQSRLGGRIDALEQRLSSLAQAQDVTDLDNRLKQAEDGAGKASDRIDELSREVDDLKQQLDSLDRSGGAGAASGAQGSP